MDVSASDLNAIWSMSSFSTLHERTSADLSQNPTLTFASSSSKFRVQVQVLFWDLPITLFPRSLPSRLVPSLLCRSIKIHPRVKTQRSYFPPN